MPRALQTAIWSRRAQWMLEQSRARFGNMFTIRIAQHRLLPPFHGERMQATARR
jgi:hypothetical protein